MNRIAIIRRPIWLPTYTTMSDSILVMHMGKCAMHHNSSMLTGSLAFISDLDRKLDQANIIYRNRKSSKVQSPTRSQSIVYIFLGEDTKLGQDHITLTIPVFRGNRPALL